MPAISPISNHSQHTSCRRIHYGFMQGLDKIKSVVAVVFMKLAHAVTGFIAFIRHPFSSYRVSQVAPTAMSSHAPVSLKFFNDYFPNVCIIGAPNSPILEESSQLLTQLGIAHTKKPQWNALEVPREVWTQLEAEVEQPAREELRAKVMAGEPLTSQELAGCKRLQGASACLLAHRRVILDTIHAYDAVVKEIEQLKTMPGSSSHPKIQELENKKKQLSSIFIFEHNSRFGRVNPDNSVEIPQEMADECKKAFEALPADWEYFSLATYEQDPQRHVTSDKIPGTQTVSATDPLVHPGMGLSSKAYALSHRSYEDLKQLFSELTEKSVSRRFYPIDNELHLLSDRQREQGRRYHIATRVSWVYRLASPSFHPDGHRDNRHFPLHDYYPLQPYNCCWDHHTDGRKQ